MRGLNVATLARQGALRFGAREALLDLGTGDRWSYAALLDRVEELAAYLVEHGVGPGEHVGLIAANSPDFLAAYFAIASVGAAVAPMPILSAPPEIAFRVGHARLALILCDGPRRELVERALQSVGATRPALEVVALEEVRSARRFAELRDAPEGTAMLLYTSGTTGAPKAARISHASILLHTSALVHHVLRFSPEEVVLAALPMTHSFGLRMAAFAPLFAGGRVIVCDRFDATRSLAVAAEEGVTWLPGVPTMFHSWARAAGAPWPALRWCLSAGAPLPPEIRARAEARLGAEVHEGYGLTEATFTCIDAPSSADSHTDESNAPHVGRAVWGVEVALHHAGELHREAGYEGEVLVRGTNVMQGYLHDPEATEAAFHQGWLRTGDLGSFDAKGNLRIVDRLKDLILRGGNNVYPSEVEAALHEHPAIHHVAVVGRPDEHYGEEVVAVVVLEPEQTLDFATLDRFARARLAKTKVPRELHVVDALPLGPSRKILRRELRRMVVEGRTRRLD